MNDDRKRLRKDSESFQGCDAMPTTNGHGRTRIKRDAAQTYTVLEGDTEPEHEQTQPSLLASDCGIKIGSRLARLPPG